jgi:hypothetical protein
MPGVTAEKKREVILLDPAGRGRSDGLVVCRLLAGARMIIIALVSCFFFPRCLVLEVIYCADRGWLGIIRTDRGDGTLALTRELPLAAGEQQSKTKADQSFHEHDYSNKDK